MSRLSALLILSPLHHSIGHSLGAAPQLIKAEHLTVAHLQKHIYTCVLEYGSSWYAETTHRAGKNTLCSHAKTSDESQLGPNPRP